MLKLPPSGPVDGATDGGSWTQQGLVVLTIFASIGSLMMKRPMESIREASKASRLPYISKRILLIQISEMLTANTSALKSRGGILAGDEHG